MKSTLNCLCFTILIFFLPHVGLSQDFVLYMTGDTSDVTANVSPAFVLAGGGTDNDDAMKWMLKRAAGGDVLVLRASGSDGYNPYFYSELGVAVNSVETIVFRNRNASSHPYILRRIAEAELIWFAGGDQGKYYDYWAGTQAGDLMAAIAENGKKVMGGTSAGMMIMGGIIYAPTGTGVISGEALSDPYHMHMAELRYNTFMKAGLFANTVFDTHFDQRDRSGRSVAFMARAAKDMGIRARTIACNEYTAVCIDEKGMARVYGEPGAGIDYAYFLEANCEDNWQPQTVEPGKPLTWFTSADNAVIVQKIEGSNVDSIVFDLTKWKVLFQAPAMYWQVKNGVLEKKTAQTNDCRVISSGTQEDEDFFASYPNPVDSEIRFPYAAIAELLDLAGRKVAGCAACSSLEGLDLLMPGYYVLRTSSGSKVGVHKVMIAGGH